MAFSDSAVSSRGSALAEINITPLVDVMLVLLVIFMVTAPMLTRSIDLSLPQPTPERLVAKPLQLRLDVAADGSYRLDDRPVSLAELAYAWRKPLSRIPPRRSRFEPRPMPTISPW
jgi:biopolymer transport protein ExbD